MRRSVLLVEINPGLFIVGVPPAGLVGEIYSFSFAGYGGYEPYLWDLFGSLPPGLSWDDVTATISGTPTDPGVEQITIRLKDAQRTVVVQDYVINVIALPLVVGGDAPDGTAGVVYSYDYTASGGVSPRVFSVLSGALPNGLSLSLGGSLTGSPTLNGSFAWTIRVTDDDGATSDLADSANIAAPAISLTGNAPNATLAVVYSYSYTTIGGYGSKTYAIISGALPTGITLNTSTGEISGSATTIGAYAWTIEVTDQLGSTDSVADSANVVYPVLSLSGSLADGTQGSPYSSGLTATGGDGSYTWSISVGSLPAGLSINTTTGVISGNPSGSGTFNFTVRVQSGDGQIATSAESVDITAVTFAAWNPSDKSANITLSNSNLTAVGSGSVWRVVRADTAKSSGKWYAEATSVYTGSVSGIFGVCTSGYSLNAVLGNAANSWAVQAVNTSQGGLVTWLQGSIAASLPYVLTGGIVRVAIDIGAGKGWLGRVTGWIGGGDPATGTSPTFTFTAGTTLYLAAGLFSANTTLTLNAGSSAFSGTIPTGYSGWSV